jgi:murein DD-endopeptidase MepM/ murein hydrolase activator NlpD
MTGLVKALKAQVANKFRNAFGSRGFFVAALLAVCAAPAAAAEAPQAGGVGGPFEAVQPLKSAPNFKQLFTSWKKMEEPVKPVVAIPSTQPVQGVALTSGYGVRAEWAGGYGNLVELNHGRGIQTRYGHLTRSTVQAGQAIKRGQLIGYMGSTGRSTGSHLHYEVRIDGKAVNPIPFMEANDMLLAVQRRANAATARVAMGGPVNATK